MHPHNLCYGIVKKTIGIWNHERASFWRHSKSLAEIDDWSRWLQFMRCTFDSLEIGGCPFSSKYFWTPSRIIIASGTSVSRSGSSLNLLHKYLLSLALGKGNNIYWPIALMTKGITVAAVVGSGRGPELPAISKCVYLKGFSSSIMCWSNPEAYNKTDFISWKLSCYFYRRTLNGKLDTHPYRYHESRCHLMASHGLLGGGIIALNQAHEFSRFVSIHFHVVPS